MNQGPYRTGKELNVNKMKLSVSVARWLLVLSFVVSLVGAGLAAADTAMDWRELGTPVIVVNKEKTGESGTYAAFYQGPAPNPQDLSRFGSAVGVGAMLGGLLTGMFAVWAELRGPKKEY